MGNLWTTFEATLLPPQPENEPPQLADVLNAAEDAGWEVYAILTPKPTRAVVVCCQAAPTKPTTKRAKK